MITPPPPADLRARVLADVAKAPATRPGAFRARSIATASALALWGTAALLALGLRGDWAELPGAYATGTLALLVLGAAGLTWIAAARGRAMVGPNAAVALFVLSALPPALSFVSMALIAPASSSRALSGFDALVRVSLACGTISVVLALPPLVAFLLLKRGLPLSTPALVGASLGAASATWAHALVHMHCSVADRWHVLLGHALPTLPLMAAGALLGVLCFRERRPRPAPKP
jgi:negative regulator of sigma F NrsF-like protein